MKTAIIGGGRGGKALIELATGSFLRELVLEVICVVDTDYDAPAMQYARDVGVNTLTSISEVMSLPELELIIELTGRDDVLEEVYWYLPPGVKLIDHTFARVFWDLMKAQEEKQIKLREITKLEQRIEKERHFLQQLFDTIPDHVIVIDKNQKVLRVNDRFKDYTGLSEEEILGKNCKLVLKNIPGMGICDGSDCYFDEVLKKGKALTHMRQSPPPDERFWQVTQTPLKNENGEIEAVLGTWYKITEQVLLKREIEVQEQRFRSFLNSALDMISIKDTDGRYLIVNPATANAFHKEPEEFLGKHPSELLPEETAKTVMQHDKEVLEKKTHVTYDEILLIDEIEKPFHTVRFPLTDFDNNVIGICTIARDVSRERSLQDELMQAGKLAAVGKLAAGVAHEINNPLTGVLAFAEDIHDELEEGNPHKDDLAVIIRETLRCRDIVKNLLDFSRQDAPKLERNNINTIISQVLQLVRKLPRFRDINIETTLTDNPPEIVCDQKQMQQVILNLMLNACEAMDGKGIIHLKTEYVKKKDRCLLSIMDDGPGIPEQDRNKIFEPFFSTKGTSGLGLAVIWGIVERHRGVIEIDESVYGGAMFTVKLPINR